MKYESSKNHNQPSLFDQKRRCKYCGEVLEDNDKHDDCFDCFIEKIEDQERYGNLQCYQCGGWAISCECDNEFSKWKD